MPASESQQIKTLGQESQYSENQNLQSYSHSEYLQRRKQKPKTSDSGEIVQGKWSEDQKIKYILFVYHHLKIFQSKTKRKNLRVFKTLSEYLGSRTPRQCRSHFQKLMNRFKNLKKLMQFHQNLIGIEEFSKAHIDQASQIQKFPIQGQSNEKPIVACKDYGIQTDLPDLTKQYEKAQNKIKMLEQMVCEANFILRQSQNYFFSPLNYSNLRQI